MLGVRLNPGLLQSFANHQQPDTSQAGAGYDVLGDTIKNLGEHYQNRKAKEAEMAAAAAKDARDMEWKALVERGKDRRNLRTTNQSDINSRRAQAGADRRAAAKQQSGAKRTDLTSQANNWFSSYLQRTGWNMNVNSKHARGLATRAYEANANSYYNLIQAGFSDAEAQRVLEKQWESYKTYKEQDNPGWFKGSSTVPDRFTNMPIITPEAARKLLPEERKYTGDAQNVLDGFNSPEGVSAIVDDVINQIDVNAGFQNQFQ